MQKIIFTLLVIFVTSNLFGQDLIIKTNGDEISAKIIEISDLEIKYKKFNYQDGPTYTVKKADIFMIKYPNGDKEVFGVQKKTEEVKVIEPETKKTIEPDNSNTSYQKLVLKSTPEDTTMIFGVKLEKSTNPDYDVMTLKDGTVKEGKLIDIDENNITFAPKGVNPTLKVKNTNVEKIALLNSNEAMNKKIKNVHMGIGVKSNQLGGDGKKDDRLVGVTATVYNKENDTIRKDWKARGGRLKANSMDVGFTKMWFNSPDFTGGGTGFSAAFSFNNYKLNLPVYKGTSIKTKWNTSVIGSGISWSFNKTTIEFTADYPVVNYTTGAVTTERRTTTSESTSNMFTIPINIGYCWASGKFLTQDEWRGRMFGLIYKPSLVISSSDGESTTKFNPIGFGFEFSRGGLQNSLDKIAPKPHTRISFFFLPPVFDLPFTISFNLGFTMYKSLKKK